MTEQEMTSMERCEELMMNDVVRIDLVPFAGTTVAVPFSVGNLSQIKTPSPMAAPLLTLGLSWDYTDGQSQKQTDAVYSGNLTHKVSESREAAGIVRTHTLQVPVEQGFQAVRSREAALHETDFYVILTTQSGARFMAYTLPNTSQFAIDEQMGENGTLTVKVTVRSMSGMILLT